MNIKETIKRIIREACALFTAITAVSALIMYLIYVNQDQTLMDAERVLLFFVFSLLFSGANGILRLKSMSSPLRLLIHFGICTIAFYLCFLLPLHMPASTATVAIALFAIFYFLIVGVIGLIRSRFKKNLEAATTYERQYTKKKK